MTYATRNWNAVESTDLVGSKTSLTVTGEVETLESNEEPKLKPAHPQGISPVTLILDLSIEKTGPIGGHIVMWKPVEYRHEISSGEYKSVAVKGAVKEQHMEVERVLS